MMVTNYRASRPARPNGTLHVAVPADGTARIWTGDPCRKSYRIGENFMRDKLPDDASSG
jgi:hypothetical protein